MKKIKVLLMVSICLLIGFTLAFYEHNENKADEKNNVVKQETSKVSKSAEEVRMAEKYVYTDSVAPEEPYFVLCYDDNTFSFRCSILSSYYAHGKFSIENDILTCKTDDGLYTYVFKQVNGGYVFDASKSSYIPEYKYSSEFEETVYPVPNCAKFKFVVPDILL